jgi:shikimate kinase
MRTDIILIGPIGAGKTTLARLLAKATGKPCVSLDSLCWTYYREIGIDEAEVANGPDGMIAWRFNVHAVERALSDCRDCIFDFGAGHSVYREPEALERIERALAPFPNIFLTLPCPEREQSARILAERNRTNQWLYSFTADHQYNPNDHFLIHPSNYRLAKHIVYTQGKTPEQSRDEILACVLQYTTGRR